MGRWPPNHGGASANAHPGPADCLDTLQGVQQLNSAKTGLLGIVLETSLNKQHYVREILLYDKDFTLALCRFLRVHKGSRVQDLGELDVTFEFLPCFI
ncbi:MAG: hypothetical protein ACHQIK_00660 [Candidatus Acidiferrales bacterium]